MFGAGNTKVRSARTLCVGSAPGRIRRIGRQPSDIAVGLELAPAPAFVVDVVDRDALALERFGIERRVRHWLAPHRHDRVDHFAELSLGEAFGLDLAFEIFRGEIGTRRRDTGIVCHRHYP